MPKMTDQEFDSLFREAANRLTPQPPQEDWSDMQSRLEMAERDARARNISLYSMVVLLLLYSFLMPDTIHVAGVERAAVFPGMEQELPQSLTKDSSGDEATGAAVSPSRAAKGSTADEAGHVTEGNALDGDVTDADVTHRNATDGDVIKGNVTKRSVTDGDVTNGDVTVGDVSDRTAAQQASVSQKVDAAEQKTDASHTGTGQGATANENAAGAIPEARRSQDGAMKSGKVGVQTDDWQSLKRNTGAANAATGSLVVASTQHDAVNGSNARSTREKGSAHASSENGSPGVSLAGPTSSDKTAGGTVINESTPSKPKGVANRPYIEGLTWRGTSVAAPSTEPLDGRVDTSPSTVALNAPGKVVSPQISAGHPWFFKVAISPDFSSIDHGGTSKPGINFGPLVEYGLSDRFSVTTGAIWSKKIYSQANPDKTYSRGSSTIKADMLDADCRIIDIPLNVTYYILPGKRTKFFVTVGSSSYVMLDEKYVYTVYSTYRNYEYEEAYSNKNIEWFSMLNLSVGIQHQIGRRCFIQGEPFLKAPVKGVGQGKVDLASAGAFISLKYLINR